MIEMGNKRIKMAELKHRISEFKNKIMYIKRKNKELKISYDFKILENLINLDKQEFENLLDSLLDFQKILYRNVKLKKMNFRYRLWKMNLKGNNLYFISENNYLNKKGKIIINLLNKEKEVIISDI
jgi:hypothetical protein